MYWGINLDNQSYGGHIGVILGQCGLRVFYRACLG